MMKIFVIGYPDNTATSYVLNSLIKQGIAVDGVIFPKNQLKRSWERLALKIRMRGFIPAAKRMAENLVVRRNEISQLLKHVDKVFFVDEINSPEVRKILASNRVSLVVLTTTAIIKPIIINIDGLTIINSHTGWLPRYRGLDANLKALRDGHPLGISIHRVTEKIDAGEIYSRVNFQIDYSKDILQQIDENEVQLAGKFLSEAVHLKSNNMLKPIDISEPLGKYEPALTVNEKRKVLREARERYA